MPGLESLPLHDAVVKHISLLWKERTIEFSLLAFSQAGNSATPHNLQFTEVSNFNCPHASPWGESFYINSASGISGTFVIEMQSGDEITIEAASYNFEPADS